MRLAQSDLKAFLSAVENADLSDRRRRAWLEPTRLLLGARTEDLRAPGWGFPRPTLNDTLAIQSAGLANNPRFRWCGHHLFAFGKARLRARWRDQQGDIVFVLVPCSRRPDRLLRGRVVGRLPPEATPDRTGGRTIRVRALPAPRDPTSTTSAHYWVRPRGLAQITRRY